MKKLVFTLIIILVGVIVAGAGGCAKKEVVPSPAPVLVPPSDTAATQEDLGEFSDSFQEADDALDDLDQELQEFDAVETSEDEVSL